MSNRITSFPAHNDPMPLHRHGGWLDVMSELQVSYVADSYDLQGTGNIRSLPAFPPGVSFDIEVRKGAPTFVNSAKLICPGSRDYIGGAGDYLVARSDGDGIWRLFVNRASGTREAIMANRTYYVRSDGSDANTGLANTVGGAKLTLQAAYDAAQTIDANGFAITFQVADGTYAAGLVMNKTILGAASVTWNGNVTTPANVIISVTNSNCFIIDGVPQLVVFDGFKVATATAGDCFIIRNGSNVTIRGINYGSCAGNHNLIDSASSLSNQLSYTISGGTGVSGSHHHVINQARIGATGITITLTGTPAFGGYFCGNANGYADYSGTTFSGSATGQRYYVHFNGVLRLSGVTLPGSVAGVATGGNLDDQMGPITCTGNIVSAFDTSGNTLTAAGVGAKLSINATSGDPTMVLLRSGTVQSFVNDNGSAIAFSSNAAGSAGVIMSHGTSSWTSISDERLPWKKTANEVTQLPDLDDFHLYGNIVNGRYEQFVKAQEFYKIAPHLVTVGSDDQNYTPAGLLDPNTWRVDYTGAGVLALAYIKKFEERLAALEKANGRS